jgi:hypothetical protein
MSTPEDRKRRVIFDPDDRVARYAAGEPIETLTARPPLPDGMSPFAMLRF